MFVDSDDWVHEDFCKQPYECAVRHQADIVMFPFQRLDKNNVFRPVTKAKVQSFSRLTHMEALKLLLHEVGNPAWNKLYNRKLFDTISFPVGYFYEDIITTYKAVLTAEAIYYLDTVLYFHCYHEGSITTLKTEKALQNYFEMHMRQYLMLSAWNYPADQLDILLNNIAFTYCMRKKADEGDANYVFCKKVLLSGNKKLEEFTWRRKMLIVLLRYCPPLFDLVCEMWGKR